MDLPDRPADIRIAVALIINPQGEMLMVRKRQSDCFIQPGGKIEPGEDPQRALARELKEELDCEIEPDILKFEGVFREWAANEPGMIVEAQAYSCVSAPEIRIGAEIEEARWLPLNGSIDVARAALSEKHFFPVAQERYREKDLGHAGGLANE